MIIIVIIYESILIRLKRYFLEKNKSSHLHKRSQACLKRGCPPFHIFMQNLLILDGFWVCPKILLIWHKKWKINITSWHYAIMITIIMAHSFHMKTSVKKLWKISVCLHAQLQIVKFALKMSVSFWFVVVMMVRNVWRCSMAICTTTSWKWYGRTK